MVLFVYCRVSFTCFYSRVFVQAFMFFYEHILICQSKKSTGVNDGISLIGVISTCAFSTK